MLPPRCDRRRRLAPLATVPCDTNVPTSHGCAGHAAPLRTRFGIGGAVGGGGGGGGVDGGAGGEGGVGGEDGGGGARTASVRFGYPRAAPQSATHSWVPNAHEPSPSRSLDLVTSGSNSDTHQPAGSPAPLHSGSWKRNTLPDDPALSHDAQMPASPGVEPAPPPAPVPVPVPVPPQPPQPPVPPVAAECDKRLRGLPARL
eukprot:3516709-Prymnesium_polylepis.2